MWRKEYRVRVSDRIFVISLVNLYNRACKIRERMSNVEPRLAKFLTSDLEIRRAFVAAH